MEGKEHEKKSFVYYRDWCEVLLKAPAELRLKIDDAIKRYVLYGEEPTDREVIYSVFALMRETIDRDSQKYNEMCDKRAESGRKGGLARVANARKFKQNQANQANQANASKFKQMQANQANQANQADNEYSKEYVPDKTSEVFVGTDGKNYVRQYGAEIELPEEYPPYPGGDYYWDSDNGQWRKAG